MAQVRAAWHKAASVWLDPPTTLEPITILDVRAFSNLAIFPDVARAWAISVWTAWAMYHEQLRTWASRLDLDPCHPRPGARHMPDQEEPRA